DVAARLVARIIGVVFVVVTLLGVFARDVTGNLLDRQPAGVRPGRCPGPTTSCMPRRPCSRGSPASPSPSCTATAPPPPQAPYEATSGVARDPAEGRRPDAPRAARVRSGCDPPVGRGGA